MLFHLLSLVVTIDKCSCLPQTLNEKLSVGRYIYLKGGGGSRIFGDFVEMLMIFFLSLTGSGAVAAGQPPPL